MVSVSDPVAFGLLASLARPGGMVTGVSNIAPDTSRKSVELLIAAVPRIKRIGFLIDTTGAGAAIMTDSAGPTMTTLAALQSLIAQGESETPELKRATAELRRAGETLCAFLNAEGRLPICLRDGARGGHALKDAPLGKSAIATARTKTTVWLTSRDDCPTTPIHLEH
ncbi:MAG: hypothetical protein IT531_22920 [Burkholderiales bacterium]|nr:hypothetical protein [Burkholderiales bacterium]